MNASAQCMSLPEEPNDQEFERIQLLAHEWAGIKLEASQRAMVYSRFCRRLREIGLNSFSDYIDYTLKHEHSEREYFVNKVTTNLTYFFREPHHFDHLVRSAVPTLQNQVRRTSKIRIWSAACSSGQEPYSIAIALHSSKLVDNSPMHILCTDINTDMVDRTRAGVFYQDEMRGLSPHLQQVWFERDGDTLAAKNTLRDLMLCNALNLFGNWPFSVEVDIIFCRNALIYFSRDMQIKLIKRFANCQPAGSYLYLGHSEVIQGIKNYYDRVENTVYRRRS